MARGAGGRPPYAAVILIIGLTEEPILAAYVRGKLALAGVDLSVDVGTWLDAAWACVIDAPYEALKAAMQQMTKGMARIRPEAARATWGLLPEHQAAAGRLGQGPGLEAGAANMPPTTRGSNTAAEVDQWVRQRMARQPGQRK